MDATVYTWRPGSRIGLRAAVAGEELERIEEKRGALTAAAVVEESRRPKAPLHGYFEWDNSVAGPLYREQQAATLLRSIAVRVEKPAENGELVMVSVRAFLPVTQDDGEDDGADDERPEGVRPGRVYRNVRRIWSSDDLRREVLDRALAELQALKARYALYRELEQVWVALDQVLLVAGAA